ncbi:MULTISPECIES: hypothetical protein [Gammaproteobacteria]|uniref:hypothetical protein n=1 Tax=Gammaproteobacteria TaxID=1236 RepID=UPI002FC62922
MSTKINRFAFDTFGMTERSEGRWVLHSDHVAMIESMRVSNEMACGAFMDKEKLQELFTEVIAGVAKGVLKDLIDSEFKPLKAELKVSEAEAVTIINDVNNAPTNGFIGRFTMAGIGDGGRGLLCVKSNSKCFTQGKRYDYVVKSTVRSSNLLVTQDDLVSDFDECDYWRTIDKGAYLALDSGREVLFKKP